MLDELILDHFLAVADRVYVVDEAGYDGLLHGSHPVLGRSCVPLLDDVERRHSVVRTGDTTVL